jgi:hypothetical protein
LRRTGILVIYLRNRYLLGAEEKDTSAKSLQFGTLAIEGRRINIQLIACPLIYPTVEKTCGYLRRELPGRYLCRTRSRALNFTNVGLFWTRVLRSILEKAQRPVMWLQLRIVDGTRGLIYNR